MRRQPIGVEPGAHQVVRRRLARRIGAARIVARGLVERRITGVKRAEHLVGGYVMEAEHRSPLGAEPSVVLPRCFQQRERADDVGLDERGRPVDRAIDMAFRRQMHHRVGLVGREDLPHRRGVGDVRADQDMSVVTPRILQRVLGGGVGQLVDVDHDVVGVAHQMAHHSRTDEAASAGQQDFHAFRRPYFRATIAHGPVIWG